MGEGVGHLIRGGRGGSWQYRPRGYDGGDRGGSGAGGDAVGSSALPDAMAAADAGGGLDTKSRLTGKDPDAGKD